MLFPRRLFSGGSFEPAGTGTIAATGFMTPYSPQVQPKFDGEDRPPPRFFWTDVNAVQREALFSIVYKGIETISGAQNS